MLYALYIFMKNTFLRNLTKLYICMYRVLSILDSLVPVHMISSDE
jgi:hypothetical protein